MNTKELLKYISEIKVHSYYSTKSNRKSTINCDWYWYDSLYKTGFYRINHGTIEKSELPECNNWKMMTLPKTSGLFWDYAVKFLKDVETELKNDDKNKHCMNAYVLISYNIPGYGEYRGGIINWVDPAKGECPNLCPTPFDSKALYYITTLEALYNYFRLSNGSYIVGE